MFSYQSCVTWIREKAEQLKSLGFEVEIKEATELQCPKPSIYLRADKNTILSDLVVWETGETSIGVADANEDEFLINRSDVVLQDGSFKAVLEALYFSAVLSR